MDFDIDSFLNETFKKVEKKDKKKDNVSKLNEIKDSIKKDQIDMPNNIKQSEKITQQKINSLTKDTKYSGQGSVSSSTQKTLIPNNINNIKSNLNKIEKKNEKLLSTKTQRTLEEKTTVSNKKDENRMDLDSKVFVSTDKPKEEEPVIKEIEYISIIKNFKYAYDNNLDIIDNDIYQSIDNIVKTESKTLNNLNTKKAEKNDKINDILLPLFPNEKVFYNEFNSEKIFLLDKFIAKGDNKKKKKQKNKESRLAENEENINLENLLRKQNKIYKKEKESSIINKLKSDKSLEYSSILETMHPLWKNYLKILLNKNQNLDTIYSKMVKADLHGANILVYDSINKNNVGIEGINLLETKRTFCLLDKKNEIKIILKKGSVFAIDISFVYEEALNFNCNNGNTINDSDAAFVYQSNNSNYEKNQKMKLPIVIKIIGDNFMYKSSFRTKAKYKNRYVL